MLFYSMRLGIKKKKKSSRNKQHTVPLSALKTQTSMSCLPSQLMGSSQEEVKQIINGQVDDQYVQVRKKRAGMLSLFLKTLTSQWKH